MDLNALLATAGTVIVFYLILMLAAHAEEIGLMQALHALGMLAIWAASVVLIYYFWRWLL